MTQMNTATLEQISAGAAPGISACSAANAGARLAPFDAGFGVYVHWPFCASKCPYCDFNSHVRRAPVDEVRYVAAFKTELVHRAAIAPGRTVTSIFFGGGTPSLMKGATVAAIIDEIARLWPVAPDAEITLEANPTSVEAGRFRDYRAAGVNRVSLGVQALNDPDLKRLGRLHSAEEALAAVKVAASIYERYSFDLIYARPHQSAAAWRAELEEAISHAVEHLSLYQLTIEPGTWFDRLYRAGKLTTPDEDLARALWDVTQEVCERHGLSAYEVSNHARPGAESRHNLVYWRYGEYAGVGPGAHGRLIGPDGRLAMATELAPEAWLTQVEQHGHGLTESELLAPDAQGDEYLVMGLRLAEGILPTRYAMLAGKPLDNGRIRDLIGHGLLRADGDRLAITPAGFPVLNAVIGQLAA